MSGAPPIFISYASPDRDRAAVLHERLHAEGLEAWFDRDRLESGHKWHDEIDKACEGARLVLPILTGHWNRSEWTKYETYAIPHAIPVIPEGDVTAVLPPPLRASQAHVLDPLAATDSDWRSLVATIRRRLAEPDDKRLPAIHHFLHDPNTAFTGRTAEMAALHEALHAGPTPLDSGRTAAWALVGLGGVGKTTLANEYARRFKRLYTQTFWVDTRSGYENQFAAIYDRMTDSADALTLPDKDKAQRALRALESSHTRLLVLDNVEDEAAADAWFPRTGGCRTLITARPRQFPQSVAVIEVPELTPDASDAFLCARIGGTAGDRDHAARTRIAERLGHLPLALEQAAA